MQEQSLQSFGVDVGHYNHAPRLYVYGGQRTISGYIRYTIFKHILCTHLFRPKDDILTMNYISFSIPDNLHFHMLGIANISFDEAAAISKRCKSFTGCSIEEGHKVVLIVHDSHPFSSTTFCCLGNYRQAVLFDKGNCSLRCG